MISLIISIQTASLTISYAAIVLYFRNGWQRLPYFHKTESIPKTMVSVLIAARNEEEKIAITIQDILAQNYPRHLFELIVVDDHSTDSTAAIIASFADQGVRLLKLNEDRALNSYKKKAITEAIKLSKGDFLVATDADCQMGNDWLSTIVNCYETKGYKMISSPVVFYEEKSRFEEMQTLEFLYLIGLGASTIGNKIPSTCNGANLAYEKRVFWEVNGFLGIDDLASGDDELLLHKVAAKYPDGIGFCKSREALVYTHAKATVHDFMQQRKRWASKSTKYKNKRIVVLGVSLWLFNLLILGNFIAGLFIPFHMILAGTSLLVKFLVEIAFLLPMCRFVKRNSLIRYHLVVTVIHIFYLVIIGILGNSGKYNWKGRMVR